MLAFLDMSLHWDGLKYMGENCRAIFFSPTLKKGRSRRLKSADQGINNDNLSFRQND